MLERKHKLGIYHVEHEIARVLSTGSDSKVVYLSLEEDALAADDTRIEVRFVNGGSEATYADDLVGMLLPKLRGLWMALERR